MKVNERTLKKIAKVLEKSCTICAQNVRISSDTNVDEYFIRYEDGNNITISLHFSILYGEISFYTGFFDRKCNYKKFSTFLRLERLSEDIFLFELSGTLHRCSEFASINC